MSDLTRNAIKTSFRKLLNERPLKRITVPALVLAGSRDLIREQETRHIAAALPNASLKILPGEGHGTYIIHQTKIADLILDFAR